MGTDFRGLNKNDTFVGFKIRGYSIFFHNLYRQETAKGGMTGLQSRNIIGKDLPRGNINAEVNNILYNTV